MSLTAALLSLRFHELHRFVPLVGHNVDLSLLLFSLVVLILAYATNPSESSFRTFLTELSFRHHLSRLDHSLDQKKTAAKHSAVTNTALSSNGSASGSSAALHFSNRASLSLRTPKHVFHSFGIFTIAAIVPPTRAEREALNSTSDRDGSMITDSWFIGAFGRWWRGGVIEAWYQDVVARSSPEEGWSSGILGMKALDRLHGHHGLAFTHKNPSLLGPTKGTPPRLRNRDRPAQRSGSSAHRSSTPPPLPKSASLPLHVPRMASAPHSDPSAPSLNGSSLAARLPTLSVDQSPRIAELHRQITAAKSSVTELRAQSNEIQMTSSDSRQALQTELDALRERRRQEENAKSELKHRTKALDDSKRLAEGSKRDAEKRLKAAETARDDAAHRIQRLDSDILELQRTIVMDDEILHNSSARTAETQEELQQTLTWKRKEIKVAEDVIAALSFRAKELEDKLTHAKEKLQQSYTRYHDPMIHSASNNSPWSPLFYGTDSDLGASTQPGELSDYSAMHSPGSPHSTEPLANSPRPARLSLGSLSNFQASSAALASLRSNGYPTFSQSLGPSSTTSSSFTVFDDESLKVPPTPGGPISPTGQSLIPSGLMNSLDINDSPNGPYKVSPLTGTWHNPNENFSSTLSLSPHAMSPNDAHDPFEVRMPPPAERRRMASNTSFDTSALALQRSRSIPEGNDMVDLNSQLNGARRWFSNLANSKVGKGLNPDAKEFNLFPHSPVSSLTSAGDPPIGGFDALNPNGLLASTAPTTSSSLLRAFAPSPAEREALQRGLGSSANASLERLPSLSDVGSIPSSPDHTHSQVSAIETGPKDFVKALPSWLQLPKSRKTNFSPWADEDSTPTQERKETRTPW